MDKDGDILGSAGGKNRGMRGPGDEFSARDVVRAVSVRSPGNDPFLIVVLRAGRPWLVPDTTVVRDRLASSSIPVVALDALRDYGAPVGWNPDLAHWTQVAVVARDEHGIGWIVLVMKSGTVSLVLDNATTRLALARSDVEMTTASVSGAGVTQRPLDLNLD